MRRRPAASLAVFALLVAMVTGQSQPAFGAATLVPVADAYVQSDQPSTNFGTATSLLVDNSPVRVGYLRFDVQGLPEPPARATLRVFTRSSSTTGITVAAVSDTSWGETTITYNNRPALGAPIGASGSISANTWFSVDVTAQIQGNGPVSFALTTTSTTSKTLDSREGANPPQLVLEDPVPPSDDPVVAAAGDIACSPTDPNFNGGDGVPGFCHMKATSDLILGMNPGNVLMLGDAQYNSGRLADFMASYDPSWGRVKGITHPTVGNHEYGTSGAGGYFSYFGDAATPRQPGCRQNCEGYYSFDIATWHVAVINTECTRLNGGNGCVVGSPQDQWLESDLAAHPNTCTLVMGHKPRWASNSSASAAIGPLVDDMYNAGVDLFLAGHSHTYERFALQAPTGQRDDVAGIRQFVVGTGGSFFTGFSTILPNSEVHKSRIFGVLKLTLHPGGYDWAYVADPSTPYSDSGSGSCH